MEEGSERLTRVVHEDLSGLSPPSPQTHLDRVNGISRHHQAHDDHDCGQPSLSGSRLSSPDIPRALVDDDEHEEAGPGDDEFESFHRSFTVGANSIGARDVYGALFPDSNNESDQISQRIVGQTAAGETTPPGAPQVVSQEQFQQPQQPQSPPEPIPVEDAKEDPTVVQARRSMMARTGDRHARGKLPEPTDGRFLPPDCPPLEPPMPASRSSKRYMNNKKRSPDVYEGTVRKPGEPGDEEHVVSCRGCNLDLVVRKAAVVVRCKNCGKVNPASSVERFDRSQYTSD